MIYQKAVCSYRSILCSATTAAVCRPIPKVIEYKTNAVAMILIAFSNHDELSISPTRRFIFFTKEKKMKKSPHPIRLLSIRVNSFKDTAAIATSVKMHPIDLTGAAFTKIHICVEGGPDQRTFRRQVGSSSKVLTWNPR
jgi:hypothetical protein